MTLNATASDAQSGVDHVAFPDLSGVSGWTGAGGNDAASPYASPANYAWSAGASAPGSKTVTAVNGGSVGSNDSLSISADSTAPAGQSIALAGGPYYTTASVGLTIGSGSDAESGLDLSSAIVERDSATLANGTCGSFSDSL